MSHIPPTIIAASAAEAELGALIFNAKERKIIFLILEEMGYPQLLTPIHYYNSADTGMANKTVKKQCS